MAVAYDLPLAALMDASHDMTQLFYQSGDAKNPCDSADAISRMTDPHDRDIMILLTVPPRPSWKALSVKSPWACETFSKNRRRRLPGSPGDGRSYNPELKGNYLKMLGRKVYNYALSYVLCGTRLS